MTIAQLRALGRKINAENMVKTQEDSTPVFVPEITPITVPVVKSVPVKEAVSSSYVVIDEEPSIPEVKKDRKVRRSIKAVINSIIHKKDDEVDQPSDSEEKVDTRQLIRADLIKSVEESMAKQSVIPSRVMKCKGCKKEFNVSSDSEMFKTGRCEKCSVSAAPVKMESAYGIKVNASSTATAIKQEVVEEAAVSVDTKPAKKGLRSGGKKTDVSGLGIDLSEIQ